MAPQPLLPVVVVKAVAAVDSRCCRWKPLVSLIAVDGRGQVVGGSHIPRGVGGIFETTKTPVECEVPKDWYSLQRPRAEPRPLEGIRTNNNIPTPQGGWQSRLPTAATAFTIPGGQRLPTATTAFATPGGNQRLQRFSRHRGVTNGYQRLQRLS